MTESTSSVSQGCRRVHGMSAVLPRNQSNRAKFTKPLSHSSDECKKKKNTFVGTGAAKSAKSRCAEVAEPQHHPFAGILDQLLSPLPADWRYNIQQAIGSFGEAVGKILPNQNDKKLRVGRRGF